MSDDRKDLPPASTPNFNERVRETLSTYLGNRGDKLDRGLTLRDLVQGKVQAKNEVFHGPLAVGVATYYALESSAATNFEAISTVVTNGATNNRSFYMDHPGTCAVFACTAFNASTNSLTETYDIRLGIDSAMTTITGFGSAAPAVQTGAVLAQGWHTLNFYAFHSAATAQAHVVGCNLLRSYR